MASVIKTTLSEPLVTGPLLYILTRGPPNIRSALLRPLQSPLLSKNATTRLAALITALKILTTLGVLRRANQALNRLAWNNWHFGRPGAQFKFGPGKEEMVVITGGSSGFGYEMVKGFNRYARVVVLDVASFPEELARRECSFFFREQECGRG